LSDLMCRQNVDSEPVDCSISHVCDVLYNTIGTSANVHEILKFEYCSVLNVCEIFQCHWSMSQSILV